MSSFVTFDTEELDEKIKYWDFREQVQLQFFTISNNSEIKKTKHNTQNKGYKI